MLTDTMIQNIEQTAAENASMYDYSSDAEIEKQAAAAFEYEYFDFTPTEDDKEEYIAAYVRGAKSVVVEMQNKQTLEAVVTPKEVSELGWAKEDTVRDACQNGWVNARKSGSTWLLLRSEAKARWGNKSN